MHMHSLGSKICYRKVITQKCATVFIFQRAAVINIELVNGVMATLLRDSLK